MSIVPRERDDLLYPGCRMSAEEFMALAETEARYELVDGALVLSPSPIPLHQRIVVELTLQLECARRSGARMVVFTDTDVTFSRKTVYRPDISVYAAGSVPEVPARLDVPPAFIAEVVSPGTKGMDLVKKREDYEQYGVGEYAAIDPNRQRAYHWCRDGARLVERAVEADAVNVSTLPGLAIDLKPVWALCKKAMEAGDIE